MHSLDPPRVFVGVDGSLGSLRALRRAITEARRFGAEVHVMYARPPAAGSELGVPTRRVDAELDDRAEAAVATWLREGLGAPPDDVVVRPRVVAGRPGPALTGVAWRDSDLLVVGARRRRSRRRLVDRSVGSYCLAHAQCPVLVVPPDSFARSVAPRSRVGGLRRRDVWKHFDATKAG